jgi:hypothetical protein
VQDMPLRIEAWCIEAKIHIMTFQHDDIMYGINTSCHSANSVQRS